ncbi:2,3-epoxybenzoyl-CoA dihydrolase [Limobrevibacterium gyesilva]|uniref:2,3-epoxybenzoyl-CoA dihydrolase n=1 Tax=Limobrevibacterium gyesilva TaxID=2991712 RepID=A0AA41YQC3_9PROT|nr:2,3-epoxybenzoyl-CoA dihydrolase [Limobrevibacterium gyesilva]MCW3476647.1 2,3-epoxybenzoyl-CoA dihydrolase [Limobrevibacterium gyesilva]
MERIDFQTNPTRYKHWKLRFEGPVAHLVMDVDPAGGLFEGYELKLNSYDLGVDIELNDAVQRLRFEHPQVRAVVLRSGKDNVFCAGANIRMLGKATHAHKVNFCKFTNETRMSIEDATENSGQTYIAAVSGACAGGGYEIAVTADHVMLIDDRRSTVALPETPLLAVLPGTGGLTRLTDKRKVRRDLADVFCCQEEGVRGKRAIDWRLVDEIVPPSAWEATVAQRAAEFAAHSDRPADAKGIELTPLQRGFSENGVIYPHVRVALDRAARQAAITIQGPGALPSDLAGIHAEGAAFWPLAMARELDDAILHLRLNEPELGLLVFRSEGDPEAVLAADALLEAHRSDWLVREIRHYLKRVLKRVDLTSRSLIALIEPGSCFAGTLAELVFAADRGLMFTGARSGDNKPPATLRLSPLNFGAYPMANGLTRLQTRFLGEPDSVDRARATIGAALDSAQADALGLITVAYDEIDWDDEVRMLLEERASFSPDALTAMEANLRFAGPETMETRIFGRLTAWQNWVFQRPNAVGEDGALKRYGSGIQPSYDKQRV